MISKYHKIIISKLYAVLILMYFDSVAAAQVPSSTLCQDAAEIAAQATGAPLKILTAIMYVESSGHPWILNIDGHSERFGSPHDAIKAAKDALNKGSKNVDIGCFQISTRYHKQGFRSISEMASPLRNALYAALFLLDLKKQKGTWSAATACYHSCEPSKGARYLRTVAEKIR